MNDFKPTHKVVVQEDSRFFFTKGQNVIHMFEDYYRDEHWNIKWLKHEWVVAL